MQPTLIIWGELDRVFPLELAHRLKRWIWRASEITFSCILVFIYALLFCPIRCEVEVIKENIFHILKWKSLVTFYYSVMFLVTWWFWTFSKPNDWLQIFVLNSVLQAYWWECRAGNHKECRTCNQCWEAQRVVQVPEVISHGSSSSSKWKKQRRQQDRL